MTTLAYVDWIYVHTAVSGPTSYRFYSIQEATAMVPMEILEDNPGILSDARTALLAEFRFPSYLIIRIIKKGGRVLASLAASESSGGCRFPP